MPRWILFSPRQGAPGRKLSVTGLTTTHDQINDLMAD